MFAVTAPGNLCWESLRVLHTNNTERQPRLRETILKLTCAAVACNKVPTAKSRRIIAGFMVALSTLGLTLADESSEALHNVFCCALAYWQALPDIIWCRNRTGTGTQKRQICPIQCRRNPRLSTR
jgi:hypothetical protein